MGPNKTDLPKTLGRLALGLFFAGCGNLDHVVSDGRLEAVECTQVRKSSLNQLGLWHVVARAEVTISVRHEGRIAYDTGWIDKAENVAVACGDWELDGTSCRRRDTDPPTATVELTLDVKSIMVDPTLRLTVQAISNEPGLTGRAAPTSLDDRDVDCVP